MPAKHSTAVRCKGWVCEHERRAAAYGMTLATLCDLVLGEDAKDRSDDALVRAVSKLVRVSSQADSRLDTGPLEEAADYIAELAKEMEAVGSVAMGCNLHAAEQAMRAALVRKIVAVSDKAAPGGAP
jgi:hypothetical protein